MLVEEVEKRTQLGWRISSIWPSNSPVIAVGTEASLRGVAGARLEELGAQPAAAGAEGYRIRVTTQGGAPAALIVGNDARGVLFGVGGLLRSLRMAKGSATLAADLKITTAPKHPIRGHQLGNRTLNNSVDAWTVPMWEQYFRDLAVFGANAVELLPPRSNGWQDSPHSPLPLLEMMVGVFAPSRRVRNGRLDLVPGSGEGLLRSRHRRVRAQGLGSGRSRNYRASTPSSCRAAILGTRPQVPDALSGETDAIAPALSSQGANVGVAAGFRSAVAGRVLLRSRSRTGVAERRGARAGGAGEPGRTARQGAPPLPHPDLP